MMWVQIFYKQLCIYYIVWNIPYIIMLGLGKNIKGFKPVNSQLAIEN